MIITVGIPTYNGKDKLKNLLESLENQDFSDFKTLIYIDGSDDETLEYLNNFKHNLKSLDVYFTNNVGRARIRNLIAAKTTTKLLLFLDDDMRPEKNVIRKHLEFHQKHPHSILVGSVIDSKLDNSNIIEEYKFKMSRIWQDNRGKALKKLNTPYITGAHFSIGLEAFNKLSGFNVKLNDAEDFELSIRAFESETSIYFNPDIVAYHEDRMTLCNYIKRQRQYIKSHKLVSEINPDVYEKYSTTLSVTNNKFKLFIFKLISSNFFISGIQKEKKWFELLPKKIQFKLIEIVVYSLSRCYPNKKLLD